MPKNEKKSYHHGNLRSSLIQAAIQLIEEQGATGLSLRSVAKAAGVSHTAPYRHFRDKKALLEAIAAFGYQELIQGCQEAIQAYPDDPVGQWLQACIAYLNLVINRPEVARLMFGGVLSLSDCGVELSAVADGAIGHLARIIEHGCRSGVFKGRGVQEVKDLTLSSWAAVHGLAMLIAGGAFPEELPSSPEQVRGYAAQVAGTLLNGMLKDEADTAELAKYFS